MKLHRQPALNPRSLNSSTEANNTLKNLMLTQKHPEEKQAAQNSNPANTKVSTAKSAVCQETRMELNKAESKPTDYQEYLKVVKHNMGNIALWKGTIGDKLNLSMNIVNTERRKLINKSYK
eukprot:TRINITY_DN1977_c0_g1_i1.p1 TRINITY_DN1977_c0_g1~~TRINITY_DN1977_c0_g1_i1.p1  ORF type:complete len:121 (+),score=25.87 TRINITY_DN1977_c0_g1_i1:494-856(+)